MADENQYLQVLLFLARKEQDRDSAPVEEGPAGAPQPLQRSEFIVYALLPRIPRYYALSKLFCQNGIIVLSIKKLSASLLNSIRIGRVELIEMRVRVGHHMSSSSSSLVDSAGRLIVSTDDFNSDILPIFLPQHIFDLDKNLPPGVFPSHTHLPLDDDINFKILKKLVAAEPDIKHRHEEGGTLLHFAVRKDYQKLVALLVESGAQVDAKNNRGNTPLHLALDTYSYSTEIILTHLLEGGANVNVVGEEGITPFIKAIRNYGYCLGIVRQFLDKGGDVNSAAPIGSVLEMAAEAGPRCLSLVLSRGPDLERNKRPFREILKRQGICHLEIGKQLSDYGFKLFPEDAVDVELLGAVLVLGSEDGQMFDDLLRWGAFVYLSRTSPSTVESPDAMQDLLSKAVFSRISVAMERIFKIDHILGYASYNFVLKKAISKRSIIMLQSVLEVGDLRLNCFLGEELREGLGPVDSDPEELANVIRDTICRHVVLIATADLRVNEEFFLNGKQFRKDELPEWVLQSVPNTFLGDCVSEVASLKAVKVGGSASTFYDVLNLSMSETVRILRNPIIRETLKSRSFETEFPRYWPLIDSRVRIADYRRTLIDKGIEVLSRLGGQLPFELREKICTHLRNHELLVFFEACGLNLKADKNATPPS